MIKIVHKQCNNVPIPLYLHNENTSLIIMDKDVHYEMKLLSVGIKSRITSDDIQSFSTKTLLLKCFVSFAFPIYKLSKRATI